MGNAFSLGKLFGIQFRLHYSWFIIFILVTVSFSWQVFPVEYPGWSVVLYWVMGTATSLLFFASVVAHELAHSLVGRVNGIPIRSITLFIFGGVAQMTREATKPRAELLMALAGPACSLVIGGLFALLWLVTRDAITPVAAMALSLAVVNVALAVFNLIPGFPLDGGRVFRSVLWGVTGSYGSSTRIASRVGQGVGLLFIAGGVVIIFLRPFDLSWVNGLWIAFIGGFLLNVASVSYRQVQLREALHGFTVSQAMTSVCPVVSPAITVSQLVQEYVFTGGQRCFLVVDEGELRGVVTLDDIKTVSQQDKDVAKAGEIMTPVNRLKVAHPEQDALSILEQMNALGIGQMLVISEGGVIGLVTRDSLMTLLRLRFKPGGSDSRDRPMRSGGS
jgi:Zn-dependent protease/predicted transcriptional regulator